MVWKWCLDGLGSYGGNDGEWLYVTGMIVRTLANFACTKSQSMKVNSHYPQIKAFSPSKLFCLDDSDSSDQARHVIFNARANAIKLRTFRTPPFILNPE